MKKLLANKKVKKTRRAREGKRAEGLLCAILSFLTPLLYSPLVPPLSQLKEVFETYAAKDKNDANDSNTINSKEFQAFLKEKQLMPPVSRRAALTIFAMSISLDVVRTDDAEDEYEMGMLEFKQAVARLALAAYADVKDTLAEKVEKVLKKILK